MKNRGAGVPADKWVRVDTADLSDGNLVTGGATDPYAAAALLRGTRTATYVGRTELAGTHVRHYRGTAPNWADVVVTPTRATLGPVGGGYGNARAAGTGWTATPRPARSGVPIR